MQLISDKVTIESWIDLLESVSFETRLHLLGNLEVVLLHETVEIRPVDLVEISLRNSGFWEQSFPFWKPTENIEIYSLMKIMNAQAASVSIERRNILEKISERQTHELNK